MVVIAGLLLAWAATAVPTLAQTPSPLATASSAAAAIAQAVEHALLQKTIQDLKEQNKELASDMKSTQGMVLEGQRKSIDWWFSIIGALVGALAVMFGALPLLLTRQQKADMAKELAEAKELVKSIRGHESTAEQAANSLQSIRVGAATSPAEIAAVEANAKAVAQNPQASDADKLRARAHLASQIQNPSIEQAIVAYEHWYALTLLNPKDANAHGNAGVMAHKLYELSATPSQEHWLSQERWHYTVALSIKEEMPDIAFNFGNLLAREALMFYAKRNIAAAQTKWHQAGEKYAQALTNRKDMPEAASNWGTALLNEAQVLMHKDPPALDVANQRIAKAVQVLETQMALNEAGRVTVAYNLACVYSLQGQSEKALTQLELSRSKWIQFPGPDQLLKDTALATLRATPEFINWFQKHFPNYESLTT
jgi:hypothetical protein